MKKLIIISAFVIFSSTALGNITQKASFQCGDKTVNITSISFNGYVTLNMQLKWGDNEVFGYPTAWVKNGEATYRLTAEEEYLFVYDKPHKKYSLNGEKCTAK